MKQRIRNFKILFRKGWVIGEDVINQLVKDHGPQSLPLICGIYARLGEELQKFAKYQESEGAKKPQKFLRRLFKEIESPVRKEEKSNCGS